MSKKISDYRGEAGFATQEQLARKLGVKRSSVAKWETGRTYPQARMLTKIAQALNITEGDVIAAITTMRTTQTDTA